MKVCYLNVNSDRRLNQPLYSCYSEKYGPKKRVELLIELINVNMEGNILTCLFEIDNYMNKELEKLENCFIITKPYNNDSFSFKFMIFVPLHQQNLISEINHKPLTLSGNFINDTTRPKTDIDKKNDVEYMEETLGELFEKSFVHLVFNDTNIIITHFGIGYKQKLSQAQCLMNYTNNINNNLPLIIGGDFNAFDNNTNGSYMEQMNVFENNGFKNMVDYNVSTFEPYPFDIRFMLNVEEQKVYDKFILESRTSSNILELANNFYNYCSNVKLNQVKPVALDNIFIKNIDRLCEVKVIPNCCNSDHALLQLNF
jgi:hypothetical protein